jgi:hypothetical protein
VARGLLAARVFVVALAAEAGVRSVPLPRLVRAFGFSMAAAAPEGHDRARSGEPSPPFDAAERRRIRTAMRVLRRWPFADGPCLRLALVLGHLLRSRGPLLHLGVRQDDDGILAHAWIEVSGVALGEDEGFVPISAAR